ncbi:unnamed protein product [Lota lota]
MPACSLSAHEIPGRQRRRGLSRGLVRRTQTSQAFSVQIVALRALISMPEILAGQLAVGTCEVVLLNRDSSVPLRTVARQTARCACRRGQIAGTTRARPACVDARIVRSRQWCEMAPCVEGEVCGLLLNRSGWTCTRGSGRIKTVTPLPKEPS